VKKMQATAKSFETKRSAKRDNGKSEIPGKSREELLKELKQIKKEAKEESVIWRLSRFSED